MLRREEGWIGKWGRKYKQVGASLERLVEFCAIERDGTESKG